MLRSAGRLLLAGASLGVVTGLAAVLFALIARLLGVSQAAPAPTPDSLAAVLLVGAVAGLIVLPILALCRAAVVRLSPLGRAAERRC